MQEIKLPEVITEAYLSNFKYQDLKIVFEKIGIKDVFKGGTKKEELIKEAVDQAAKLKKLKDSGIEDEKLDEQLKILNEESAAEQAELAANLLQESIKEEENKVEELKERKLTKEHIEKNIQIIDMNLKMGIPSQRVSLIQKRKQLKALL